MRTRNFFSYVLLSFVLFQSGLVIKAVQQDPQTYNVKEFGAVGDGMTLNTKAIQDAIDAAYKNGGGKVVLSGGKFLSGSIELKNGVILHLDRTATLLGSINPRHYRRINNWKALIVADHATGIVIEGEGAIDGQGRALALNVDSLHHIGEMVDPNYNYRRMRPNESYRPQLVYMMNCSGVKVTGVTLKNASCWVQTYEQCSGLEIHKVKVESRAYWNNDGFDIVDCKDVRITHCDVNTADDGICLKSHSPDHICDQVYIANCTVRSSASAVKFGTASHGGFKNVVIENIKVFDTFRSAIAIESVDGGVIENISVSNIIAINTGNAIFIRLGHRHGEQPGVLKNISIKDMYVQVPFGRPDINYDMRGPEVDFFHNPFPASIAGIPGHYVENVVLENIEISYPGRASKGMAYVPLSRLEQVPEQIRQYPEFSMFRELPAWGFYVRHAKNIEMKNITLKLEEKDFRPGFVFDDVHGLHMQDTNLPIGMNQQVVLKNVTGEQFDNASSAQVRRLTSQ